MKIKRYTIIMSLATVLLGLVSCTQDESTDNIAGTADLQLSTEIATTRSIIEGSAFSNGDRVELYVSSAANGISYVQAVNDDGKWIIAPKVELNSQSVGVVGIANYPYNNDISPDSIGNQQDFLIGLPDHISNGTSINAANPEVHMTFHHALARVSFLLKQSNGSDKLTRLSLVNVGSGSAISTRCDSSMITNAAWQLVMSMASNRQYSSLWSSCQKYMLEYLTKNRQAATMTLNKTITLSEKEQTIDLLVFPTSINSSNKVSLELAIGGNVYKVEMPTVTWSANVRYVYPVNIDVTKDYEQRVSIGNATIEKWGAQKSLDEITVPTTMDY